MQALWRRASKLGLRKKEYIKYAKEMILNLKALSFNKLEDVDKRFLNIQKYFLALGPPFTDFLQYFECNWIHEKKFPKELWNYYSGVIKTINFDFIFIFKSDKV